MQPLLFSVLLLLGCSCANAESPGNPVEMISRWREEATRRGRPLRAVLDDPEVAQTIWSLLVDCVEGVRRGGSDSPEYKALGKLFEQHEAGTLTQEQIKDLDARLEKVGDRTAMSGKWHLDRLSAIIHEIVSLDDDRVMNLIGPLFAETSRISPEFDSPAPSVQLQAVHAAKELSRRGILPKDTRQLQDPREWEMWWAKHSSNYEIEFLKQVFGTFKLPPNKVAAPPQK